MPSTKSSPHSLVPSSLEDSSLDILLQPNITIELLIPLQLGSKLFTKFISQICLPTMSCWSSFGHVDTLGRLNLHHWTSNSHVSVLEQSIAIEGPCRTRSGCLQQPLKSLSWLSGRKKWPCHPLLSGSCKLYKHSLFSPDFAGCQLVFYNNWKIMSNTSSLHLDWHKILMGVQLNYHYAMGIPTTKVMLKRVEQKQKWLPQASWAEIQYSLHLLIVEEVVEWPSTHPPAPEKLIIQITRVHRDHCLVTTNHKVLLP